MSRQAHPWFRRSDGWWYVKINGKQQKLVQGRKNREAAIDRWHEFMTERASNPSPDSRDHTIASVIDLYLIHAKRSLADETYQSRKRYLQWFAEAHGFRLIRDCLPIHLTQWLDANPQWATDWTRSTIVKTVQRPFNWATRQRIVPANPFLGVTQRLGEPRRPMADDEFVALLRATVRIRPTIWPRKNARRRPTAGMRFRQVLYFLRYTGARPGEMAALTWKDVDFDHNVAVLQHHKTRRTQRTPRPRIIQLVPRITERLSCRRRATLACCNSGRHSFVSSPRMLLILF